MNRIKYHTDWVTLADDFIIPNNHFYSTTVTVVYSITCLTFLNDFMLFTSLTKKGFFDNMSVPSILKEWVVLRSFLDRLETWYSFCNDQIVQFLWKTEGASKISRNVLNSIFESGPRNLFPVSAGSAQPEFSARSLGRISAFLLSAGRYTLIKYDI